MKGKFLSIRKLVIPMLTILLINMVGASTAFAYSNTNVNSLLQDNTYVTMELVEDKKVDVMTSAAPGVKAPSRIYSESGGKIDTLTGAAKTYALSDIKQAEKTDFNDVKPEAWYYKDVMKAREAGLMQGTGGNNYSPDEKISYAEFLTIVSRIADKDLIKVAEGTEWYDKYVQSNKNIGTISKDEAIDILASIPREDMVKYTCKALKIPPSDGTDIVFEDIKSEDAKYINAAFEEYITDGVGRNEAGNRLFGFGQTADRSQLATMANRMASYLQDPTAFKQERAVVRATEEKKYIADKVAKEKAEQEAKQTHVEINGYKVPKTVINSDKMWMRGLFDATVKTIDFGSFVPVTKTECLDTVKEMLESKFGKQTAIDEAIDYAKTKTDRLYNLEEKGWTLSNGQGIGVYSIKGSGTIKVEVGKAN